MASFFFSLKPGAINSVGKIWLFHKPTGWVCLLLGTTIRKADCQFGAGGPFERVWKRDLGLASEDQVARITGVRM
jgi:hypothetical protein